MVQFDQLKLVCITGYFINFSEEDIAEFRKSVISHSHCDFREKSLCINIYRMVCIRKAKISGKNNYGCC